MANATTLPGGDTLAPCALTVAPPGGAAAACETIPAMPFTLPAGALPQAVELSGDEMSDADRMPLGLIGEAPVTERFTSLAGLAAFGYAALSTFEGYPVGC